MIGLDEVGDIDQIARVRVAADQVAAEDHTADRQVADFRERNLLVQFRARLDVERRSRRARDGVGFRRRRLRRVVRNGVFRRADKAAFFVTSESDDRRGRS